MSYVAVAVDEHLNPNVAEKGKIKTRKSASSGCAKISMDKDEQFERCIQKKMSTIAEGAHWRERQRFQPPFLHQKESLRDLIPKNRAQGQSKTNHLRDIRQKSDT